MVVYRGSGVLNFAHGAIGHGGRLRGVGGARRSTGSRSSLALVVGVVASAAARRAHPPAGHAPVATGVSAGAHRRDARRADPAAVGSPSSATARASRSSRPSCRRRSSDPFGQAVSIDRFILLGIAAVLSFGLWALYRYTKFGLSTSAVAENQRAASTVGLSPDRIAVAQLVARVGARRPRRDPGVTDRHAAGLDDDEPRAGGDGRRARRQLPVVPDRLRRRRRDRRRADRADATTSSTPGVANSLPFAVIIARDDLPGAGAARPRLVPPEAARRRQRAGASCGRSPSASRWRSV